MNKTANLFKRLATLLKGTDKANLTEQLAGLRGSRGGLKDTMEGQTGLLEEIKRMLGTTESTVSGLETEVPALKRLLKDHNVNLSEVGLQDATSALSKQKGSLIDAALMKREARQAMGMDPAAAEQSGFTDRWLKNMGVDDMAEIDADPDFAQLFKSDLGEYMSQPSVVGRLSKGRQSQLDDFAAAGGMLGDERNIYNVGEPRR